MFFFSHFFFFTSIEWKEKFFPLTNKITFYFHLRLISQEKFLGVSRIFIHRGEISSSCVWLREIFYKQKKNREWKKRKKKRIKGGKKFSAISDGIFSGVATWQTGIEWMSSLKSNVEKAIWMTNQFSIL